MNVVATPVRIPNVNTDYEAAKAALVAWYTTEAWRYRHPHPLIIGTCERLQAAGVPLSVFNAWILTLHPDYFGVVHIWRDGAAKIESQLGTHDQWDLPMVQNSPLRVLRDGAAAVRRRLDTPGWPRDYPVLDDYADEGATDYVAMALPSLEESTNSISFSTRRPGGFTAPELSLVDAMLPYMARQTDIQSLTYLATTVLDTYVGHSTGERILSGAIRRGTGETIHAVIWQTDLRNFTGLSNSLPRDEMLALLNDYFDCVGDAVAAAGGEILKFVGDAMLAIQPLQHPDQARAACARAVDAVRELTKTVTTLNRERRAERKPPIEFGLALHLGDVVYGNIGTKNRLDFTVIGPAVNEISRIEGLCRPLGETVLLSKAFADAYDGQVESLGCHDAKGFDQQLEVFRLPAE